MVGEARQASASGVTKWEGATGEISPITRMGGMHCQPAVLQFQKKRNWTSQLAKIWIAPQKRILSLNGWGEKHAID